MQPGYSPRLAEDQDLANQQPDGMEEQDDTPQVDRQSLETAGNVDSEPPFINDEDVYDDDDDDEAPLPEEKNPEQPDYTGIKKSEFVFQYKHREERVLYCEGTFFFIYINTGTPQKTMSADAPTQDSSREALENSPSVTQVPQAVPFENAAMKEPTAGVASSLGVVCHPCLSELSIHKCIRSSGFCKEPSHEKVCTVHFPSCMYTYNRCLHI